MTTGTTGGVPFRHGYPEAHAVPRIHADVDHPRAVEAYRFFYPTLSMEVILRGTRPGRSGRQPLRPAAGRQAPPRGLHPQLRPPCLGSGLDLRASGPLVVNLPPGHGGHGPLGGYEAVRSDTWHVLCALRALPFDGDLAAARRLLASVRFHPCDRREDPPVFTTLPCDDLPMDTTPLAWEDGLEFWRVLHHVIDTEPAVDEMRPALGTLAELGIQAGRPFDPDESAALLTADARQGRDEMLVAAFAFPRPDRTVWDDRAREWAGLRDTAGADHVDLRFGSDEPPGTTGRCIQTVPGRGWFAYFRIYGPERAAFDGTWRPADFEKLDRPPGTRDRTCARAVAEAVAFVAVQPGPARACPAHSPQVRTSMDPPEPCGEELESVLGATPHEFGSRSLRQCLTGHDVEGPHRPRWGPSSVRSSDGFQPEAPRRSRCDCAETRRTRLPQSIAMSPVSLVSEVSGAAGRCWRRGASATAASTAWSRPRRSPSPSVRRFSPVRGRSLSLSCTIRWFDTEENL